MRLAVMGAGGVGGYFGARLAQAGEDVTFIARGAHLAAMRESGLRVTSALGDCTITPAQATDDPAAIGPVDYVLFSVKMYDTESAAEAIRPLIGPDTAVISLQNGIDNEDKLACRLGAEHVVGGVSYIFAAIDQPGLIRHSGQMARLVVGELDGQITPRLEAFRAAGQQAGLQVDLSADIRQTLWLKFLSNCASNGLTSVTRTPIGPIREDPDLRALCTAALEEVAAVGRAEGINLPPNAVSSQLAGFDRLPYDSRSSTEQDLARGKRLEIAYLNGRVAELGRRHGIPTPVNHFIYTVLKPHAAGHTG
ncbi:MAG TPA: 2-dehydropantoate 2-reductase [Dehalococcoidia bacterium]|nr:2-dehydropantoate 2-reductase [Dehalococcoidia bacterium]